MRSEREAALADDPPLAEDADRAVDRGPGLAQVAGELCLRGRVGRAREPGHDLPLDP